MSPIVLDGKSYSLEIENELKDRVGKIVSKVNIKPILATILVGDDPSSRIYVNMKGNACKRIGLGTKKVELPEDTTTETILTSAVIIDAGYHQGGIGDVEKSAYGKASAYTPVPGGVGPMTIAILMSRTVEEAERLLS
jgi:5,10-methylene-tetrahydrofolate dehydrogenase/methenyl tetrahydrofolate cyclohydrolase